MQVLKSYDDSEESNSHDIINFNLLVSFFSLNFTLTKFFSQSLFDYNHLLSKLAGILSAKYIFGCEFELKIYLSF